MSRTHRIMDKAEARDKNQMALSAIEELRSCYEYISKITFAMHEARLSELEMERVHAGEPDEEQRQLIKSNSGDANQDGAIEPDEKKFGDSIGQKEVKRKPLIPNINNHWLVRTKSADRDD